MAMKRWLVIAAGAVPALVILTQAYLSQPLSTGLGLPAGWVLINPSILVAGAVWLLICTVGVVLLSRLPSNASKGTVLRRAAGAFGLVVVTSWLPVTVFMRLSAYTSGLHEDSEIRMSLEVLVEVMTAAGVVLLIALLVDAIWRARIPLSRR
jgi:hypothetical protein